MRTSLGPAYTSVIRGRDGRYRYLRFTGRAKPTEEETRLRSHLLSFSFSLFLSWTSDTAINYNPYSWRAVLASWLV